MYLKQSTAATIVMGPFVDSTDGVTAETALTISQADVRLSKNAGTYAQKSDTGSATHMESGHYSVSLNTTDTNTLGHLRVAVNESGALPVWRDFLVLPANVYDSLLSTDKLQVHVDEMTAGIITAAVIATDAIDADALADNAITAATFAADAITAAKVAADVTTEIAAGLSIPTAAAIADAVWDESLGAHLTAGSTGDGLYDASAAGGDPWNTTLPGSYTAGQAGYILGTNVDQKISLINQDPGAGAIIFTYTLTNSAGGAAISGADVWATSDLAGTTDGAGQVVFYLDAGTVYIWRQKPGWNFTNPDTETVA